MKTCPERFHQLLARHLLLLGHILNIVIAAILNRAGIVFGFGRLTKMIRD